jgi:hypothetical protein
MKKGQVTLFIIVGIIVIVLLAAGIWFTRSYLEEKQTKFEATQAAELAAEAKEIEKFVDVCVKQTAYAGLERLGKQAGYINLPEIISVRSTGFWYLDQVNIQPTLNQTLKRLETYIEQNLERCTDFIDFEAQGFAIKHGQPTSAVFYTPNSVKVDVEYFAEVKKQGYTKTFERFNSNLEVRFRRMFELASQIVNRQLDPAFEFSQPLALVNRSDFDVTFHSPNNETIIYTITDNTRFEEGKHYQFTFASRFRNSNLKRTVKMQPNSNVVATVLPYIIYSLDRMAQLNILPGTTFNLEGESVESISVQQFYPNNVTRTNVPFHEHADNSVSFADLTWVLTYPVYEFEPTGMRFNSPQRLVLHWDPEHPPIKDMGILFNEGEGWRPLPSKANYDESYIYTDIPGFSQFTPVDCRLQEEKDVSATAEIDPGAKCFIIALVIAAVIAFLLITLGGAFLVGLLGPLLAGIVIVVGSLVGGAYISSALTYSAGEDTITFTPTCDQEINIIEELSGGEGMCIPSGTVETVGGEPQSIQATISKCTGMRKFMCGKCKLTCSTKYQ